LHFVHTLLMHWFVPPPQHEAELTQGWPVGTHPPGAHCPATQLLEQHWLAWVHVMPAPLHVPGGPHIELLHSVEQH
jgi:hypothetical protein